MNNSPKFKGPSYADYAFHPDSEFRQAMDEGAEWGDAPLFHDWACIAADTRPPETVPVFGRLASIDDWNRTFRLFEAEFPRRRRV